MVNQSRLFLGSCFALITTAFSFSIRAGILNDLSAEFHLSAEQLGFINSMWFLGFPIAMIIGGLIYHRIGPKIIMLVAFVCHALGIILTIYSGGYTGLLLSTFLIGIGNGCTEAACNPMIADAYSGSKMSTMLNRFHMWFPGGIVVGSLLSFLFTHTAKGTNVILDGNFLHNAIGSVANFLIGGLSALNSVINLGWQAQIWLILIPTLIYAYLFFGQTFPKPKVEGVTSIKKNLKAMATPLYIFMFCCMALTAISEFGPQQWTDLIMKSSGASPMIILALVTGLMAVTRYFAGPIIEKFDQTGVLLGSAILATIGVYLFSTQTGEMIYVAAIFFALGVALFWPNMVGFIAEKVPLSGALGMSVIGGIGMFSTAIFQPIIGSWIDSETATAAAGVDLKGMKDAVANKLTDFNGISVKDVKATIAKIELTAGQATLDNILVFPAILIVAFTILYFWRKNAKTA